MSSSPPPPPAPGGDAPPAQTVNTSTTTTNDTSNALQIDLTGANTPPANTPTNSTTSAPAAADASSVPPSTSPPTSATPAAPPSHPAPSPPPPSASATATHASAQPTTPAAPHTNPTPSATPAPTTTSAPSSTPAASPASTTTTTTAAPAPAPTSAPAPPAATSASTPTLQTQTQPPAPVHPPPQQLTAVDKKLHSLVVAYLKKKGYSLTEDAFLRESTTAPGRDIPTAQVSFNSTASSTSPSGTVDLSTLAVDLGLDIHTHLLRQIYTYNYGTESVEEYEAQYRTLKNWIGECLDVYRTELTPILWPLFVHVFLQLIQKGFSQDAQRFLSTHRHDHDFYHRSELYILQAITTEQQFYQHDIVKWMISRKIECLMSSFSHHLLVTHLEEHGSYLLLKLINEHIHVRVITRRPMNLEVEVTNTTTSTMHKEIKWGLLPEQQSVHTAAYAAMRRRMREELRERRERERKEKDQRKEDKDKEKEEEDSEEKKDKDKDKDKDSKDQDDADEKDKQGTGMDIDEDGGVGGAGEEEKVRRDRRRRRRDDEVDSAHAQNKRDEAEITRVVQAQIPIPKNMHQTSLAPATNHNNESISLPPMRSDVRERSILDLQHRMRLHPNHTLPSICMYTFFHAANNVSTIDLSGDGALVATGHLDSTVRVWDIKDKSIVQSTAGVSNTNDNAQQPYYGTGQGGSVPVLSGSVVPLRMGDDSTPSRLPYSKLVGHSDPVYATSFSPEGQYMLSGGGDATIRMWHLESKRNVVVYRGHTFSVWDVAFCPLGFYFASASHDTTARLWSTNSPVPLRMFVGHLSDVEVVRFHPNCNYIATGSSDRSCRLWDIQTGECVRLFNTAAPVTTLAMDPEGRYMSSGATDGSVAIWDLGTGRKVSEFQAHASRVTSLAYSSDSALLASGGMDHSVKLWHPKQTYDASQVVAAYRTKWTPITTLKFTPRNVLLAAGIFQA